MPLEEGTWGSGTWRSRLPTLPCPWARPVPQPRSQAPSLPFASQEDGPHQNGVAGHLDLGLPPPEPEAKLVLFQPPSLCCFVTAPELRPQGHSVGRAECRAEEGQELAAFKPLFTIDDNSKQQRLTLQGPGGTCAVAAGGRVPPHPTSVSESPSHREGLFSQTALILLT